jgi:polysaccharide lyase-like protein/predicted actin-binding protein
MRRRISLIVAFVLIVIAPTSAQAKEENAPGQSPPSNVSLPTVAGVAVVPEPLTGDAGTWNGPAQTYTFSWYRCNAVGANCVSIAGATSTTYVPGSWDVGSTIRVVVVATNKNGATVATSNPTPTITSPSQPTTTSTTPSSTTSTTTPTTTTTGTTTTVTPPSPPTTTSAAQTPTTSTTTPTTTTTGTTSTTVPTTTTVATTTIPTITTFFTTTTATPSTTTTATTPVGNLFWSAGFESGDLREFAGVHTGLPTWGNSSATVVQKGSVVNGLNNPGPYVAPVPHTGSHAAALLVDGPASATGSAGGQRAELTSGYYSVSGTERWYGISVYIPSAPNRNAGGDAITYNNAVWEVGWGTSLSLKTNGTNGDNQFNIANGAATTAQKNGWSSAYYNIGPILYDQWVNFTIHVFWATDSTGYFEVYENGALKTLTGDSVPSFSGTRVNGPNFGVSNQMVSEYDWYRGSSDLPSLLYLDDLKIGDTYAVVQPG